MSKEYNEYLSKHKYNVGRGFLWFAMWLPDVIVDLPSDKMISYLHDESKKTPEEYNAYDAYFYGSSKEDPAVVEAFDFAWLHHIHANPHHWQHWVLLNDDPGKGTTVLKMPYSYIIEMICDWWSFSWSSGDLFSIFTWYDEHKDYIKLHPETRVTVEDILDKMKNKLRELNGRSEKIRLPLNQQ